MASQWIGRRLALAWLLVILQAGAIFGEHGVVEEVIVDELSPDLVKEEATEPRFFAAVIDAGSTGTRLHLFEFKHSTDETANAPFELVREVFKEVKPGLSAFASHPEKAAASVRVLLTRAKEVIPERLYVHSPVIVQATAGLRLLPGDRAEKILDAVRKEVDASGLLVGDEAVGILSGKDEGIFGWFTLNFLTGRLSFTSKPGDASDLTAAALDLGGGSTQLTFNQRADTSEDRTHVVSIFGREFELYTHSYLGNGLVSARLGIASLLGTDSTNKNQLRTHCMAPGIGVDKWEYVENVYQVSATEDASFEKCLVQATDFVKRISKVRKVDELKDIPVFAFSYFFDRGSQVGMIQTDPITRGGWIQLSQFKLAATQACAVKPDELGPEHWRPWLCMDLTYMYALLSEGYGLPDDKNIHLTKRMRDMEVSWALGAGFHLLNSYHQQHFDKAHNPIPASNLTIPFFLSQVVDYLSAKATHVLGFFNLIS
uniref:Nucleoside-diphosphatase mig-23 n=1 Tax=Panagrellus redivivus TaxID=6233 RepID=A0A7E4VR02_PANRE